MLKVVVNADDYGYDENRTKAILAAWRLGMVTTTTMLVNYPGFDDAVALSRDTGLFDHIGLHLNLTRGVPLTENVRRSRLFCDEKGEFNGGAWRRQLTRRFVLPSFERHAVAAEVKAQMAKYLNTGFPMRHLDSHHHVHNDWSVARIVLPMAHEMGFKTIRLASNIGKMSCGKWLYKKWFNGVVRKKVGAATAYFGSFEAFRDNWQGLSEDASTEVMTHPMFGTLNDLRLDGPLTDSGRPFEEEGLFWRRHADKMRLERS